MSGAANSGSDGMVPGLPLLSAERIAELRELEEPGSNEFFSEVVAVFREDGIARLRELRSAAAEGDAERVYQAAHALKGEALTCGAQLLAATCRDVEQRARDGDLSTVSDALPAMERLFAASAAALEAERDGPAVS